MPKFPNQKEADGSRAMTTSEVGVNHIYGNAHRFNPQRILLSQNFQRCYSISSENLRKEIVSTP
jgi:hypothetical protein